MCECCSHVCVGGDEGVAIGMPFHAEHAGDVGNVVGVHNNLLCSVPHAHVPCWWCAAWLVGGGRVPFDSATATTDCEGCHLHRVGTTASAG